MPASSSGRRGISSRGGVPSSTSSVRRSDSRTARSSQQADRFDFPALGRAGARTSGAPLRPLRLVPARRFAQGAARARPAGGARIIPAPRTENAEGDPMKRLALLLCLASFAAVSSFAQEARDAVALALADTRRRQGEGQEGRRREGRQGREAAVVTRHQMTLGGKPFAYTATAGYMPMKDENGKLKANIFFIAYTKDGASTAAADHLRLQRRARLLVRLAAPGRARPQARRHGRRRMGRCRRPTGSSTTSRPGSRSPTSSSSTRSRPATAGPAEGEKPEQFHGVRGGHRVRRRVHPPLRDASTARWARAEVPRRRELRHDARRRALRDTCSSGYGMYLNGIVLISTILNFQTADFNVGNDLPYVLFLPTLHDDRLVPQEAPGRPPGGLRRRRVAESEKFAMNEYTLALMKGDELPGAERQAIVAEALAPDRALRRRSSRRTTCASRCPAFTEELLRAERRTVGRLDSRFTGVDRRRRASAADQRRPELRGDLRRVHGDAQRLRARGAQVRERPALRDPDRAACGPGTTAPLPEPVRQRGRDAARRDDAEPAP